MTNSKREVYGKEEIAGGFRNAFGMPFEIALVLAEEVINDGLLYGIDYDDSFENLEEYWLAYKEGMVGAMASEQYEYDFY